MAKKAEITSQERAVRLRLPNFELAFYKPSYGKCKTISIAISTPIHRNQSIHLYAQDIPIDNFVEMLTRTLDMISAAAEHP